MSETAKERLWRQWAIDGMPKDKIRLAEAAYQAGMQDSDMLEALNEFPNRVDYANSEEYSKATEIWCAEYLEPAIAKPETPTSAP